MAKAQHQFTAEEEKRLNEAGFGKSVIETMISNAKEGRKEVEKLLQGFLSAEDENVKSNIKNLLEALKIGTPFNEKAREIILSVVDGILSKARRKTDEVLSANQMQFIWGGDTFEFEGWENKVKLELQKLLEKRRARKESLTAGQRGELWRCMENLKEKNRENLELKRLADEVIIELRMMYGETYNPENITKITLQNLIEDPAGENFEEARTWINFIKTRVFSTNLEIGTLCNAALNKMRECIPPLPNSPALIGDKVKVEADVNDIGDKTEIELEQEKENSQKKADELVDNETIDLFERLIVLASDHEGLKQNLEALNYILTNNEPGDENQQQKRVFEPWIKKLLGGILLDLKIKHKKEVKTAEDLGTSLEEETLITETIKAEIAKDKNIGPKLKAALEAKKNKEKMAAEEKKREIQEALEASAKTATEELLKDKTKLFNNLANLAKGNDEMVTDLETLKYILTSTPKANENELKRRKEFFEAWISSQLKKMLLELNKNQKEGDIDLLKESNKLEAIKKIRLEQGVQIITYFKKATEANSSEVNGVRSNLDGVYQQASTENALKETEAKSLVKNLLTRSPSPEAEAVLKTMEYSLNKSPADPRVLQLAQRLVVNIVATSEEIPQAAVNYKSAANKVAAVEKVQGGGKIKIIQEKMHDVLTHLNNDEENYVQQAQEEKLKTAAEKMAENLMAGQRMALLAILKSMASSKREVVENLETLDYALSQHSRGDATVERRNDFLKLKSTEIVGRIFLELGRNSKVNILENPDPLAFLQNHISQTQANSIVRQLEEAFKEEDIETALELVAIQKKAEYDAQAMANTPEIRHVTDLWADLMIKFANDFEAQRKLAAIHSILTITASPGTAEETIQTALIAKGKDLLVTLAKELSSVDVNTLSADEKLKTVTDIKTSDSEFSSIQTEVGNFFRGLSLNETNHLKAIRNQLSANEAIKNAPTQSDAKNLVTTLKTKTTDPKLTETLDILEYGLSKPTADSKAVQIMNKCLTSMVMALNKETDEQTHYRNFGYKSAIVATASGANQTEMMRAFDKRIEAGLEDDEAQYLSDTKADMEKVEETRLLTEAKMPPTVPEAKACIVKLLDISPEDRLALQALENIISGTPASASRALYTATEQDTFLRIIHSLSATLLTDLGHSDWPEEKINKTKFAGRLTEIQNIPETKYGDVKDGVRKALELTGNPKTLLEAEMRSIKEKRSTDAIAAAPNLGPREWTQIENWHTNNDIDAKRLAALIRLVNGSAFIKGNAAQREVVQNKATVVLLSTLPNAILVAALDYTDIDLEGMAVQLKLTNIAGVKPAHNQKIGEALHNVLKDPALSDELDAIINEMPQPILPGDEAKIEAMAGCATKIMTHINNLSLADPDRQNLHERLQKILRALPQHIAQHVDPSGRFTQCETQLQAAYASTANLATIKDTFTELENNFEWVGTPDTTAMEEILQWPTREEDQLKLKALVRLASGAEYLPGNDASREKTRQACSRAIVIDLMGSILKELRVDGSKMSFAEKLQSVGMQSSNEDAIKKGIEKALNGLGALKTQVENAAKNLPVPSLYAQDIEIMLERVRNNANNLATNDVERQEIHKLLHELNPALMDHIRASSEETRAYNWADAELLPLISSTNFNAIKSTLENLKQNTELRYAPTRPQIEQIRSWLQDDPQMQALARIVGGEQDLSVYGVDVQKIHRACIIAMIRDIPNSLLAALDPNIDVNNTYFVDKLTEVGPRPDEVKIKPVIKGILAKVNKEIGGILKKVGEKLPREEFTEVEKATQLLWLKIEASNLSQPEKDSIRQWLQYIYEIAPQYLEKNKHTTLLTYTNSLKSLEKENVGIIKTRLENLKIGLSKRLASAA